MTDAIDEMFARDLEKVAKGLPSELAANAAQVSASQDPEKKGAEKPDLYAKGKGRGKGGRMAEDEKNDERKSKGPNKGEAKEEREKTAIIADLMVGHAASQSLADRKLVKEKGHLAPQPKKGLLDKIPGMGKELQTARHAKAIRGAMSKESEEKQPGHDVIIQRHFKKRFLRPSMKQVGMTISSKGRAVPRKAPAEKKASLDAEFDADLRQIVGAEAPDTAADFQRPDVRVEGQTTDRIDDAFVDWMHEKADEDVVKAANAVRDLTKKVHRLGEEAGEELLRKQLRRAMAVGAAGTAATGVAGAGLYHAGKRSVRQEKTAGVIENPENADLLTRIRRAAQQHTHGCSDV